MCVLCVYMHVCMCERETERLVCESDLQNQALMCVRREVKCLLFHPLKVNGNRQVATVLVI